jgi:phosphate transport system protein
VNQEHTVKSFDAALARLDRSLARMGGAVESQLAGALEALDRRDPELAGSIPERDVEIDRDEQTINLDCVRLLALRQPMAADLRTIMAVYKATGHLERMGDHAAGFARRAIEIVTRPPLAETTGVLHLGKMAQEAVRQALDSFIDRDCDKAEAVHRRDDEVDALYNQLFRDITAAMSREPSAIAIATPLLFMAKSLERIADQATDIAQTVLFMVRGEMPGIGPIKLANNNFSVI